MRGNSDLAPTKRRAAVALALLVIITAAIAGLPTVQAIEKDAADQVTRVIDGDTFDTSSSGRIRLADIDAPERGEPGYSAATSALTSWVGGKQVYLDIDDLYREDAYGRLVCVVYAQYNTTHVVNVNKALLDAGYVVITDYSNEFNPYQWTTYEPSLQANTPPLSNNPVQPFFLIIITVAVVATIALTVILVLRPRSRARSPPHS